MTDQAMSDSAQGFLDKWGISESTPTEALPELPEETIPAETTPYAQLLEEMESYNQQLWESKQTGLKSPADYEIPSFYLREYGIDNEMFGVIHIPKLELTMPIYLGATEQHMVDGAVHLSQTSLPIGGINSNSVLAGHRGYNGADYFRFIPELHIGDEVILTNLWGELRYKVVGSRIIAPNDIEEIFIQEGRDLLTLLTCHPYASGGRQRYLVFCERI